MSKSLTKTVGVIGPAGFSGSYLCVELIRRDYTVVGISRNPQSFGNHRNYVPRSIDIEEQSIVGLTEAFRGLDVLVSVYGPHTAGADALEYMPYVEVVRKLVLAVKKAGVPYFVFVGGAGSLVVPGGSHECLIDHSDFLLAYRRQLADSNAHVLYMEERLGPMGAALRSYRNARLEDQQVQATEAAKETIRNYEAKVQVKDRAADFIKAGRTSLLFFEGNQSFPWTFVSPSPMYRPGRRTGKYEITVDMLPLKDKMLQRSDNIFDGLLPGITAADLAVAIADEVENKRLMYKHWTATGDLSDDTPYPSYLKADAI